jgi:hypothetical protein
MKKRLKMKKYESGGGVDDDDPESQRVFRSDGMTEYSDEERMPRGAKSVASKAAQTGAARASAMEARGRDDREISSPPSRSEQAPTASSSGSNVNQIPVGGFDDYKGKYPTKSSLEESLDSAARYIPGTGAGARVAVGKVASGLARAKPVETLARGRERVAGKATADVLAKIDARKSAVKMGKARRAAEKEDEVRDYLRGASYGDKATGHRTGGSIKREVKRYSSGGSVSASRRADGIASRGKTRGKIV